MALILVFFFFFPKFSQQFRFTFKWKRWTRARRTISPLDLITQSKKIRPVCGNNPDYKFLYEPRKVKGNCRYWNEETWTWIQIGLIFTTKLKIIYRMLLLTWKHQVFNHQTVQYKSKGPFFHKTSSIFIFLTFLFYNRLQTRRIGSSSWGNEKSRCNFNPRAQASDFLGHRSE